VVCVIAWFTARENCVTRFGAALVGRVYQVCVHTLPVLTRDANTGSEYPALNKTSKAAVTYLSTFIAIKTALTWINRILNKPHFILGNACGEKMFAAFHAAFMNFFLIFRHYLHTLLQKLHRDGQTAPAIMAHPVCAVRSSADFTSSGND